MVYVCFYIDRLCFKTVKLKQILKDSKSFQWWICAGVNRNQRLNSNSCMRN